MPTWVQRWLGVDLHSSTAAVVVLSLAECVYFNWFDKWFPSTHSVLWRNHVKFTCLVHSSLTNIIFRCPGSSGGCALGEVGLLIYFGPSFWHIPFLPALNGYSQLLPQHWLVVWQPMSFCLSWVRKRTPMVCSANSPPCFLTLDPVEFRTDLDIIMCNPSEPRSFRVMVWR